MSSSEPKVPVKIAILSCMPSRPLQLVLLHDGYKLIIWETLDHHLAKMELFE